MAQLKNSRIKGALIGLALAVSAVSIGAGSSAVKKHFFSHNSPPAIVKADAPQKRRIFCDSHPKTSGLIISVEKNPANKTPGATLTQSCTIPPDKIFYGLKPLAFACHEDGTLWWLSDKDIYRVVISPGGENSCDFDLKQKLSYTTYPEYDLTYHPNSEILNGAMWWPEGDSSPTVAVVSKNLLFQAFKPDVMNSHILRHFFQEIREWKFKNESLTFPSAFAGIALGVANGNEFSIIPYDYSPDSGKPSNHILNSYLLQWRAGEFDADVSDDRKPGLFSFLLTTTESDAQTTIGVSDVVFSSTRGGKVVLVTYVSNDGTIKQTDLEVEPPKLRNKTNKDMGGVDLNTHTLE